MYRDDRSDLPTTSQVTACRDDYQAEEQRLAEAIVVREYGGPEVLRPEEVVVGVPAAGEVRIRQTAVGVNFHDVYVRSGLYKTLDLPGIPGIEGVGVVEEVGEGVTDLRKGDRVAYVTEHYGVYASERLMAAELALKLPSGLDDRSAATVLLKGLTAQMLLCQVEHVRPGMDILVHAAAGGVGQLLCQWARHLGANVIGTVGSEAKMDSAAEAGCSQVILHGCEDLAHRVREITSGKGVDIAYDSVGKDTFAASLESLAPFGHLVNFGQSSGSVPAFEVSRLAKGSNSLTRPIVFHYTRERERLLTMASDLFEVLGTGVVKAGQGTAYQLCEAAQAHADLESRNARVPIVLLP